jgi:soluble lytic murein transglycosylase
VLVIALVLMCMPTLRRAAYQWRYPCKYTEAVEQWAEEYDLDPLLIYTFIRTESGFSATAESSVGARGLMQITEETFIWLKSKIAPDEGITFDDLYDASTNIRFGAYYIKCCLARYNEDVSTAAAAYHSGCGTVNALLTKSAYTDDGKTLSVFPYAQMNNYVWKITRTYQRYQELYGF